VLRQGGFSSRQPGLEKRFTLLAKAVVFMEIYALLGRIGNSMPGNCRPIDHSG